METVNKYILNENIAYILDNKNTVISKIDLEDVEKCADFKWILTSRGYIISNKLQKRLHHYVLDFNNYSDDCMVDHINRDKTDNRKCNLRVVNKQINNLNESLSSNSTSGYKGVSLSKSKNKWRAHITLNGKYIHLGYFSTREEAYIRRIEYENKLMSELLEDYNGKRN